ncbi:unnamed protein product, partial [Ectocarpus sp. 4 AP-2014]
LTIRDGSRVSSACCGTGDSFVANEIVLESGLLSVPLAGETPIRKITDGTAYLDGESSLFDGRVDIYGGALVVGSNGNWGLRALGSAETVVHPGGRLVIGPERRGQDPSAPFPKVTLAGGELYGVSTSNDVLLSLRGPVQVTEDSTVLLLDGTANQNQPAPIVIDGSIHVRSGVTLTVLGQQSDNRGLTVTGEINLEPGATLAGTGSVRSELVIDDGAILSP